MYRDTTGYTKATNTLIWPKTAQKGSKSAKMQCFDPFSAISGSWAHEYISNSSRSGWNMFLALKNVQKPILGQKSRFYAKNQSHTGVGGVWSGKMGPKWSRNRFSKIDPKSGPDGQKSVFRPWEGQNGPTQPHTPSSQGGGYGQSDPAEGRFLDKMQCFDPFSATSESWAHEYFSNSSRSGWNMFLDLKNVQKSILSENRYFTTKYSPRLG